MRLWHKFLIPYLPRQQLLRQWRECCLIAKNISEKGTPNHLLVNRIMEYPLEHFIEYSLRVYYEMDNRGYRCNRKSFDRYLTTEHLFPYYEELFSDWHNEKYLIQCYFNLEEKWMCGGIPNEDFFKVREEVSKTGILPW